MNRKLNTFRPPGITEVCGSYDINAGTDREPLVVSVGRTYVPRRARSAGRDQAGASVVASIANQIAPYVQFPMRDHPESIRQRLTRQRGGVVAYLGQVPEHVLAFGMAQKIPADRMPIPGRYHYLLEQCGVTSHDDLMRRRRTEPERVSRYLAGVACVVDCTIDGMPDDAHVYFAEQSGLGSHGMRLDDTRRGSFFRSLGCEELVGIPGWGTGEGVLGGTVGHTRQELHRQYPFLVIGAVTPGA